MRTLWKKYLISALALTLALFEVAPTVAQTSAPSPSNGDSEAISQLQALIHSYAKSVDDLDLDLARKVWSASPEVTFIHPLGTERGLQQVLENLYGKTMGMFSKRELLPDAANIHVYGDTAWAEFTWTFHGTMKESGANITTHGRETQIYRRENGTWHIVHIHYSGMPAAMR